MATDKKKKRPRASLDALEMLLSYVEKEPSLHRGRVQGLEGKRRLDALWKECAATLNEKTIKKTVTEWKESWKNLVRRARLKNAANKAAYQGTGNPDLLKPLSEMEQRILSLVGTKTSERLPGHVVLGEPLGENFGPLPSTSACSTDSVIVLDPFYELPSEYGDIRQDESVTHALLARSADILERQTVLFEKMIPVFESVAGSLNRIELHLSKKSNSNVTLLSSRRQKKNRRPRSSKAKAKS